MTGAPSHQRRAAAWLDARGLRWERVRYARPQAGGEVAAVRLLPPCAPRGRIVAAHGAGNDAFFPLLPLLADAASAGFEVFAFDADGNGWESTTRFEPEVAAGAVAAAVDAASAGRDRLPLHLVGHSLGGSMTLRALADGVPAASAVVLSAPIDVSLTRAVALAEVRGFLVPQTLRLRRCFGAWGTVPAVGRLKRSAYPFRRTPTGAGGFEYVEAVRDFLRRLDPLGSAAGTRVPVLLVYGGGDALVPPAQGEALVAALPHGELLLLHRASHWSVPLRDATGERVAAWLDERAEEGR